ncbi:MAG TPA: DUF2085 domain-containing protein [Candidatus Aminicenantes bacterium]|nr:DUF2085 domain-containing protein [Candidatus Aminicenantes bacterium]
MSEVPLARTVRAVYAATAAVAVLWLLGIFLAPWLAARGAPGASRALYALFSPVCHQAAGRCFTLLGRPLAVCGRCLGIYAGFAAGLLAYPLLRGLSAEPALPPARAFVLAVLPLAVDGTAGVLGLWRSPLGLRFATGLAWGTLLPFYALAGAVGLARLLRERRAERALENRAGPQ